MATAIKWYNPEGHLVSLNSGEKVYQFVADYGRAAILNFISYSHSLKGKYECRVHHVNNSVEKLNLCISEYCMHITGNADRCLEIF